MATVENRVFEGVHTAVVTLTCPQCHEGVDFSFDVAIRFEECDTGLPMEILSKGRIDDQPLFDHYSERH